MSVKQSSISLEYVRVPVAATVNGAAVDPTSDAVKFAFKPEGVTPATGDFVTGSWETAGSVYLARCLVGPAGAAVLTPGSYRIWIKITDSPEVPARDVDSITIT